MKKVKRISDFLLIAAIAMFVSQMALSDTKIHGDGSDHRVAGDGSSH